MPIAILFWVLMLLALFLGSVPHWRSQGSTWAPGASNLCLFLALAIAGWEVFGPAITD